MTVQPITYGGRTVAACTRRRAFLSAELDTLPADHPRRLLVMAMCLYAGEILNGLRTGPYRDSDARDYAIALLLTGTRPDFVARQCQGRGRRRPSPQRR